jgi:Domain of unknown function (DUF4136)
MRLNLTLATVILLSGGLLSHVSYAQKTSAGYDKTANFPTYKTFMFSSTHGARNPIVNDLIMAALVRELTARGLTRVEANPDLRVSYVAASGFNLQVADVSFGYTVNPVYSGLMPTAGSAMWDVTTGTLLIDLFDNKTDRIVFRGTAKDVLQRAPSADAAADAKMVSKQINKGIAKIFKKYPAAAK